MKNLAPIGITTYTRINHLQKTVSALQRNTLAGRSILHIYSDGPKEGDEEKVTTVRKYIRTISGFKEVHITERKNNDISSNNYGCIKTLLSDYGRMIFLEDDIVTAPLFLKFINDGLDFYEDNDKIAAISGYNLPGKFSASFQRKYFLSRYFNAWGFGVWQNRHFADILDRNDAYDEMEESGTLRSKVEKVYPDLVGMLRMIKSGALDAGDYKISFHCIKNDLLVARPVVSLVDNIGHDGSGVNCGVTDRFRNELLNSKEIDLSNGVVSGEQFDVSWYVSLNGERTLRSLPERLRRKFRQLLEKTREMRR